jgi:hypothetical protein
MPSCVLPLIGVSASFAAAPGVTVNAAVPLVSPAAEAVIVALPTVVALNADFATPLVGVTGVDGVNDPDTPLAEKVTGFAAVVTVLPKASLIVALYVMLAPALMDVDAGVNLMPAAAPAVAVAVKVTEPMPLAVATTRFVPVTVPRVSCVEADPALSVTTLAEETDPPPAVTAKVTVTPGMFAPALVLTRTTSGLGSVVATTPVWLFPLRTRIVCADAGNAGRANKPIATIALVKRPNNPMRNSCAEGQTYGDSK